ncbi:MAG: tetratricopeptide repeat protein [Endozoicomonas sp.]|uniref:tetratricopeptide repeat protein n=1 Tax=Endozoicomonas sp. TaxID=1892382 RepID=UPI003D9AC066
MASASSSVVIPVDWIHSGRVQLPFVAANPAAPQKKTLFISPFVTNACIAGESYSAELDLDFDALIDGTNSPGVTLNASTLSTESQNWSVTLSPLSLLSFLNEPFSFLFMTFDSGLPCFPAEPHAPSVLTPQRLNLTQALTKARQSDADVASRKLSSPVAFPILVSIDENGFVTLFIVELNAKGGYRIRKITTTVHFTSQDAQDLLEELRKHSNVSFAASSACVAFDRRLQFLITDEACETDDFLQSEDTIVYVDRFTDIRFFQGQLMKRIRWSDDISDEITVINRTDPDFKWPYEQPRFLPYKGNPRQVPTKGNRKSAPLKQQRTVTTETITDMSEAALQDQLISDHQNGWNIREDWRKIVAKLENAGKYDEAIAYLKVIIEFYPSNFAPKKALIWALVKRNSIGEARQLISDWMRNPDNTQKKVGILLGACRT